MTYKRLMIFNKLRNAIIKKLGGYAISPQITYNSYNLNPIVVQADYEVSQYFACNEEKDWIISQSKRTIINKLLEGLIKSNLVVFDHEFDIYTNTYKYRGRLYVIDPKEVNK